MLFTDLKNFFYKLFNKVSYKRSPTSISLIFQKYAFYFFSLFLLTLFYFLFVSQMRSNSEYKKDSFESFVQTKETLGIKDYLLNSLRSPYREYSYIIQNNDSIEKILKKYKIKNSEIKIIVDKLRMKKLSNIYSGRKISIVVKKIDKNLNSIVNILYPVSNTLSVEVRKSNNDFQITENIIKLYKKEVVVKNIIKDNLYSSAVKAKVEPNIIIEFARIYGFEIDFQRDIRKGDWFEIYYEKFLDDGGVVRDTGKIIYASMFVNNREINLYNFKHNKDAGYYDLNGKSIVKSLMKTPINGARLSSSFGNREHPILGYTKLHTGTDFAAPSGTPIMASGSGTIIRSRWCGGGGNCVKIKHNSTYSTVYAHMKSFAKGIKEGRKVKQGQVIGYVGSTGMSTGPHLHYEVIVNGKKVNSQKLKLPSGKLLKGEERKKFEIERIKVDLKLSELR